MPLTPRPRPRAATPRARAAAFACAAAIAALTLVPLGRAVPAAAGWRCVGCGDAGGADLVGNVLLFAPLGALLVRAGARPSAAAAAGALLSLAVELAQAAGIPGRSPALGDLLANGAGAAVGAALAARSAWLAAPPPRAAWALATAAGGGWLALTAAAAWLLGRDAAPGPRPPRTGMLAHAPGLGYFHGRVTSATVDGWAAPPQRGVGPALVGAATGPDLAASVAVAGGDGRPSLVPILLVHDAAGRAQLLVGQRGGDAVLRVRLRAARWRLHAPALALAGALAAVREGGPPAAARLDAVLRGDTLRLAVLAGGTRRVATARLTPGTAWRLLPAPGAWGPERRAPSALWLAATLAPFGYWLGRAAARGGAARAGALAAAVVAGGLLGVPAAAGHAAAPWWEWAGAALGVTAAWVAAWAAARPARPPAPDATAPGRPRPGRPAPGRPAPGRPAPGSAERRVAARSGPGQLSPP